MVGPHEFASRSPAYQAGILRVRRRAVKKETPLCGRGFLLNHEQKSQVIQTPPNWHRRQWLYSCPYLLCVSLKVLKQIYYATTKIVIFLFPCKYNFIYLCINNEIKKYYALFIRFLNIMCYLYQLQIEAHPGVEPDSMVLQTMFCAL